MLRDIKPDDLRRLSSLRALYGQATAAGWLSNSEANLRNFVAAAARATRVNGDPVRIFVGIVRKGLWHHVSNEDELRALRALKRAAEKSRSDRQIASPTSTPDGAPARMRTLLERLLSLSSQEDRFETREIPALEHLRETR